MIFNHRKIIYSLALSATLLSCSLSASTNEKLVNSIIELRGDVESLYTDIKENKQRYHSQMKSLSMQITDFKHRLIENQLL